MYLDGTEQFHHHVSPQQLLEAIAYLRAAQHSTTRVGYEDAGLPRPKHRWQPRLQQWREDKLPEQLPVPWINGPCVRDADDWHSFRGDALSAHHDRLCVVCGLPLGERMLIGSMGGDRATAGPGGHPRCILLATSRCPHLYGRSDSLPMAFEYIGLGVGYQVTTRQLAEDWGSGEEIVDEAQPLGLAEVREIARRDPWGIEVSAAERAHYAQRGAQVLNDEQVAIMQQATAPQAQVATELANTGACPVPHC